jgi:hypothetical protein
MAAPPLIPLIVHERCIGHFLARGREGHEAFDADEQSLGVFPTAAEAVAALIAASSEPEDAAS